MRRERPSTAEVQDEARLQTTLNVLWTIVADSTKRSDALRAKPKYMVNCVPTEALFAGSHQACALIENTA